MRKALLLITIVVIWHTTCFGQPQAYESKIDYQKVQQTAAAIDLPYSTDLVEDAIKNYMAKKGLKGSGEKGFTLYRGVRLADTASQANDLYFKVDRHNRDRNASTVSLLVARPNEDIATRAPGNALPLDGARDFLNKLVPAVEASDLEKHIGDQQSTTKKSQKKYNGLQDDQAELEKKIRDEQTDLDQNKKDQILASAAVQANLTGDQDALKKAQKQLNKLLDKQSSLEKKLRKHQADLAENKANQAGQQADLMKQQQTLDTLKTRRVNP